MKNKLTSETVSFYYPKMASLMKECEVEEVWFDLTQFTFKKTKEGFIVRKCSREEARFTPNDEQRTANGEHALRLLKRGVDL